MTKVPAGAAPVGKLRTYLLAWTLGPIALFLLMDAVSLYRSTQRVTAQVHDRLLEATARQIGDRIHVERNELSIHVPLAMVEAIEGSSGSRMYYRVLGFDGQQVAGDSGLVGSLVAVAAVQAEDPCQNRRWCRFCSEPRRVSARSSNRRSNAPWSALQW